ncbi:hypothetical protein [Streptomyces endophyticus]|uniref:Uncharacterized protein n=1 Tax=Streptomyces endophyticus TaxID=714166 RepID=A0ABU6F277_9ACTN|nr:hypothetical protein [Streptomyces endophyticus]MEB8338110.1 hypothetical protein [Streptomyces endophyticus]
MLTVMRPKITTALTVVRTTVAREPGGTTTPPRSAPATDAAAQIQR